MYFEGKLRSEAKAIIQPNRARVQPKSRLGQILLGKTESNHRATRELKERVARAIAFFERLSVVIEKA